MRTRKPSKTAMRPMPLPMTPQCGECRACCIVFDVAELNKPRRVPCIYLKPEVSSVGNCSIWNAPIGTFADDSTMDDTLDGIIRKPAVCRDFECLYKRGIAPPALKPSLSGVVFNFSTDSEKIIGFETEYKAADSEGIQDYIATLNAAGIPVFVVPYAEAGAEEPARRIFPPIAGKNPKFDAELKRLTAAGSVDTKG
jgi:hypothetical protein